MIRAFRWATLGLLLVVGSLIAADGDKKKDGGTLDPQKQQEYNQLVQLGRAPGKVVRLGSGSSFTLQVTDTTVQPGSPNHRGGMNPPRLVVRYKDFDLRADEDVVVRILKPPLKFDEKGKPVPYTAEELKELRGPDLTLPGYTSSFDDLKANHLVLVVFNPKYPPTQGSEQGKENDKDARPDYRPMVTMIVILGESNPPKGKGKK